MNSTWNIVANGQMNQGAVNGSFDMGQMFTTLWALAMKSKANQQYVGPTHTITITYAD